MEMTRGEERNKKYGRDCDGEDTRNKQNINERWMKETLNHTHEYVHHFPTDLGKLKIGHSYITVHEELPVTRVCNAQKPHLK